MTTRKLRVSWRRKYPEQRVFGTVISKSDTTYYVRQDNGQTALVAKQFITIEGD